MAIQDIATAKPRQKGLPKKSLRKKEIASIDKSEIDTEEQAFETSTGRNDGQQVVQACECPSQAHIKEEEVIRQYEEARPEDVPDGAQISRAFNNLCQMVRDRMRGHKKPEPANEYFTQGRYVLVTGESSYMDPYFFSCSPHAGGGISVILRNGATPSDVLPIPEVPEPPEPADNEDEESSSDDGNPEGPDDQRMVKDGEKDKENNNGNKSDEKKDEIKNPPDVTRPEPASDSTPGDQHNDSLKSQANSKTKYSGKEDRRSGMLSRNYNLPSSMSYKKVEVVESIEKISDDRMESYEETAMIVETMIEKTSKKK